MSETAGLATSSPAMDLQDQTTWTTHEEATLQAISRTVEDQERRESSRRTCHSRDSPAERRRTTNGKPKGGHPSVVTSPQKAYMDGRSFLLKVWSMFFWIVKSVGCEWPILALDHVLQLQSTSHGRPEWCSECSLRPVALHQTRLPSATNQTSRVVNLSDIPLDRASLDLLGRGPHFALGRTITAATLHMVEMGVQRAIYGLKWIQHRSEKSGGDQTEHALNVDGSADVSVTDSQNSVQAPLPSPHFSDSYACQPPTVSTSCLERFRKLKYRIMSAFRSQKNEA